MLTFRRVRLLPVRRVGISFRAVDRVIWGLLRPWVGVSSMLLVGILLCDSFSFVVCVLVWFFVCRLFLGWDCFYVYSYHYWWTVVFESRLVVLL